MKIAFEWLQTATVWRPTASDIRSFSSSGLIGLGSIMAVLEGDCAWFKNGQKKSERNFKNDYMVGSQTGWYENGQKSYEYKSYKSGIRTGISYDENGQKYLETYFNNGKTTGIFVEVRYHENGQKWTEAKYKSYKRQADLSFTSWYENGQKRCEGNHVKGKQNGPWTFWDENGEKTDEKYYV